MDKCVRENTAIELIEESGIESEEKALILSILKDNDYRNHKQIERYETRITEQNYLIEAYRTVLKDMVYSDGVKNNFRLD